MIRDDHDVKVLNALIASLVDSADGYEEASQDSAQSRFDEIFDRRFKQRYDLTIKLQDHVRSLGGDPERAGTLLATAHRAFTRLKSALAMGDAAVISEVERGEADLRQQFETALADPDLAPVTRSLIESVYDIVRADADELQRITGTDRDRT